MNNKSTDTTAFSPYQKFVVALLTFLQFTVILDFMIMSPLGAILMPTLKISPKEFAAAVSAYAFSAGISGFLAAGFADRFDRKKLLLFFYGGFILGTLFCGLATNFHWLMAARIVSGVFGGVLGSVILAISTDLFPLQMRGRVMGYMQMGFAASQILGIPIGLYFANLWGWHAPFLIIVFVSLFIGAIIFFKLKPVDEHLKLKIDSNPFHHLLNTLKTPRYMFAYALTALLTTGGFMLMPFGSAFTVHNLGIDLAQLPITYLVGGLVTIVVAPLVGKFSDRIGKFRVFVFGAILSSIMVIIYTHLGITPLWLVITVNAILFVGIFSRMIPAQALTSAIPTPANRGAFMSVNSSLQQISGGLASVIAGHIVVEGTGGMLEHFDTIGYVLVVTTFISTFLIYKIHRSIPEVTSAPAPAAALEH